MIHRHEIRVYYEDTDAGGIVYHANYLRFAERARTELLRSRGLDHPTLLRDHGGMLAVVRCDARFIAPARLDDLLAVETETLPDRGVRLRLAQTVRRGGDAMCRLEVELAFLDADMRPRRLPRCLSSLPGLLTLDR